MLQNNEVIVTNQQVVRFLCELDCLSVLNALCHTLLSVCTEWFDSHSAAPLRIMLVLSDIGVRLLQEVLFSFRCSLSWHLTIMVIWLAAPALLDYSFVHKRSVSRHSQTFYFGGIFLGSIFVLLRLDSCSLR